MLFVDLFVYWLFSMFFPKKKEHTRSSYRYDTTGLLIADSLIRNDNGSPKTYSNINNDPFLNEDYYEGPDW